MPLDGLIPVEVEDFGGLYTNVVTADDALLLSVNDSIKGASIRPSALTAKNIRFIPGSGFEGRPGLTEAFTFASARKATHISQLITQQDERKFLVIADDGSLQIEPDSGTELTVLKSDWAPATAIGHSATLFDREHLAVSDGKIGTGVPLVWDGVNLDRMSPAGPGTSHTLAAGIAGVVTNGLHKVVVFFETRHGYRTKPNTPVEITVVSNQKIVVSNIPIGPSWVRSRIVAMTTAAGASYFFSAEMVIDDNTTTTLTIDISDNDLSASTLVDKLFRRVKLPDVAGFRTYNDRMVAWGGRKEIPIENTDFDGGFDPAAPTVPASWATGVATIETTVGPFDPATATGWANSNNVFTSNDVRATTLIAAGGTSPSLDVTNFPIPTIPGGATILGITATNERFESGGTVEDVTVQLLKAGAPVGSNKASPVTWPASETVKNYGGSGDLWGTTWTPAEINASNFGIRIAAGEFGNIDPAGPEIDHVTISITYSEATGGAQPGGSKEEGDVYSGFAYKITGDGATDIRGDIIQTLTEEFAKIWLPPEKKVKFRVRAKKSVGLLAGAVRIGLDNTSNDFLLTAAQITTSYAVYESAAINIESFPTQMSIRGDSDGTSPLTNTEAIFVDSVEVALSDDNTQPSLVFVSDASDPEAFDGVKGFMQVSPDDGQKVVNCFKFRDLLFIAKERSLYVTRNDSVNPAALWEIKFVDNIGCDGVHAAAVAGEQFAILSYRAGVYAIFGLRPEKINQEIQQSPAGFPSWDDREEPESYKNHVIIDAEKKEVYCSVVRSGDTWPTRTFQLNYWGGWGEKERKWAHYDWNLAVNTVTASALVEESSAQSILFGAEKILRHTGTSDDGRVIDHDYRMAYFNYWGSYGDSLYGALAVHGLTSTTNLIIQAYELDDTLRTITNGAGEQIVAAQYLEMQMNLIHEKLSFRLRSNTLDSTMKIDALTIWGQRWYETRGM